MPGVPAAPPAQGTRKPGGVTGGRLVKRVVTHWSGLSNARWRVLAAMCASALDDPDPSRGFEAALYFGGHGHLARALGLAWPEGDDHASATTRAGSLRNVRKVIAALEEAKAVKVADPARKISPGTSQAYRILVEQGSCPPPNVGSP